MAKKGLRSKKLFVLGIVLILLALVASIAFANGYDYYDISNHTYTRSDGVIRQEGVFSGAGMHRDNPLSVNLSHEGPIPHGSYNLKWRGTTNLGPDTVECIPTDGYSQWGRSGFYIHGGTKSEGCIIIYDAAFRRSLDGHFLIVH